MVVHTGSHVDDVIFTPTFNSKITSGYGIKNVKDMLADSRSTAPKNAITLACTHHSII